MKALTNGVKLRKVQKKFHKWAGLLPRAQFLKTLGEFGGERVVRWTEGGVEQSIRRQYCNPPRDGLSDS